MLRDLLLTHLPVLPDFNGLDAYPRFMHSMCRLTKRYIMTRHTISVLVENKFGVLARIAGLFSGRGYNIHSLNVAPSQDPRFSRMTIVVREREDVLNQIIKHLEKLVNTVEVIDFRNTDNVYREIVLLRVGVTAQTRHEVVELSRLFHAQIVDVTKDTLTIEVTGDEFKIDRFLTLMKDYDIQLLTRSGKIALPKPEQEDCNRNA